MLAELEEGASNTMIQDFADIYSMKTAQANEMLGFFTMLLDKGVYFTSFQIEQIPNEYEANTVFIFSTYASIAKLYRDYNSGEMMLSINGVNFQALIGVELWQIFLSHYKAQYEY